MSNVLRRNRATSEVEFIHNATRIRKEITSMVMNEKVFPKRYRFVYSIPMIDLCRELVRNANTYYNCVGEDDNESFLYKRKKEALMNMYDCCEDILAEMQEVIADLIATYGEEIITITNKIFTKLKERH